MSTVEKEKLICKSKLEALDLEESQIKDDRFSCDEKMILLNAFQKEGYQIFQDMSLLHKYMPLRRESDLKGLVERLHNKLNSVNPDSESEAQQIDGWLKLSQQILGNFAKDKRVSMDDVFSEAVRIAAPARQPDMHDSSQVSDSSPNTNNILNYLAQLLSGRCPQKLNNADALVCSKLHDHIDNLAASIDVSRLDGSIWHDHLQTSLDKSKHRQERALEGLNKVDGTFKKHPSANDIQGDQDLEALCLELPKIRRITDMLNPLRIDESLMKHLFD